MGVTAQLVAMTHDEELANGCTSKHHQNQHQPVQVMVVQPAVVVGQHGKQHGQCEVSVVHAALLAALTVDGVHGLTGLDGGHHFLLAGNDPEEHVGTHGGRQHGAYQQESRLPGEEMASQIRSKAHQYQHQSTYDAVTTLFFTKDAADAVVQQPEHHQKSQRHHNGGAAGHDGVRRIDQIDIGIPQVGHRQQRKARQPGGVAFPVEPVRVLWQLGRCTCKFDGVVEAPAVQGPQLAADTLFFQVFVLGRREAAVQKDKVERGTHPGDGGNDVQPPQQQVGPVEDIAFHSTQLRQHRGRQERSTCSPLRAL